MSDSTPGFICLFPGLPKEAAALLERYHAILKRALPMQSKHVRLLPANIRDLSRSLTMERGSDFRPDYMGRPETIAAYCHYFLPWNLVRLSRLFLGLNIDLKPDSVVMDLGAGPLTAMQALWIARPDLREIPMTWHCLDKGSRILKTGKELFLTMAPNSPWRVVTHRTTALQPPHCRADLVIMANVLNELHPPHAKYSLSETMDRLCNKVSAILSANGKILAVEPGTRLASRGLIRFREQLLERDFGIYAPCPHHGECPMPGTGLNAWCHFPLSTNDAPAWLNKISSQAGLSKSGLSLSFLWAGREESEEAFGNSPDAVRLISKGFRLPEKANGQYGCSSRGKVMLTSQAASVAPGLLVTPKWPDSPGTDAKSGALILPV
ncbi:MAG: small ribosomal subunit Rsm22 family protein [Desulfovibrio sp.]|uniref:small ribosomal subunit Rsm22 family protein n=1 Tax=Desulfovibrio sp. 7SRBS1 TaxID=3378064 RepID=UPI003B3C9228